MILIQYILKTNVDWIKNKKLFIHFFYIIYYIMSFNNTIYITKIIQYLFITLT